MRLHGTYARRVLRSMDADLARMQAAAASCRRQYERLSTEQAPHPKHEAYQLGAELGLEQQLPGQSR